MRRRRSLRSLLTALLPRRLVVFLDYDGTLTPIVRRPAEARLEASMRRTLCKLACLVPVVIVSGRALSDVQRRVGIPSIRYVAHHGLNYKEPGSAVRWLGRRIARKEIQEWANALGSAAKGIAGALVEDKGVSVALHERLVRPSDRPKLRRQALRALAPWLVCEKATLVRGKCVFEVKPAGSWNKGTAVAMLLRQPWARRRIPVYFGDDRTDFDAFSVMRGRGLAVRVGGRPGVAGEDARVAHPKRLHSLLAWLAARLEDAEIGAQ